jgi:hypothetical protein
MNQQLIFQGILGLVFAATGFAATRPSFKILEQTTDRLRFKIRPTLSWALSLLFGGIGLLCFLFNLTITPVTQLTCEHSGMSTNCDRIEYGWLGQEKARSHFTGIQKAVLETQSQSDSTPEVFKRCRAILLSEQDAIPITDSYVSRVEPEYQYLQTLVSQVNAFVDHSTQERFVTQQEQKLLGYTGFAIASVFGLVGILISATAPSISCTFDRENGSFTLVRSMIRSSQVIRCKINDILAVDIESQSDQESTTYRLILLLTSGERLPLTRSLTNGRKDKQQLAAQIQQFLNNPILFTRHAAR